MHNIPDIASNVAGGSQDFRLGSRRDVHPTPSQRWQRAHSNFGTR